MQKNLRCVKTSLYYISELQPPITSKWHDVYGREILHADPCPTWPGHRFGKMSLMSRPFEKISLFLKFCSHTS